MWVCATGARHSKSLERRCPRTACLRRGAIIIYSYYTRCALIREVETVERRKRDAAAKRRKIANEDQEETVERRERDAAAKRRENSVFMAGAYNYIQLLY